MKMFKKSWGVISTLLVLLIVLCAVFLMGSRLMGYQVYTIISGSMQPEYEVGDLIYVKAVDPADIRIGDDITFVLNEDLVVATHRVIRIDAEKQHIYTKGIANEVEDSTPVHFNNVLGVVRFNIPLLGFVSSFIQNPPGTYITFAVGAVLIIVVFLPDFLPKKKTPGEEENERLRAELEALRARVKEEE